MIDVEDLTRLRICERCRVVFMPQFKKGCDFEQTPYPVNPHLCERCKTIG